MMNKNLINVIIFPLLGLSMACSEHKTEAPKEKFTITDSLLKRLLIDTVQQASGKTDLIFSAKISANETPVGSFPDGERHRKPGKGKAWRPRKQRAVTGQCKQCRDGWF